MKMTKIHAIIHPVKKEFRRERCGCDHEPADAFVKSQWQNCTKSVIYLVYRWIIALFFTGVVVESMINQDDQSNFWLYFIYMTNWGILLCMITNVYIAVLVTIWHHHPEYADKLLNMKAITSPIRIYWILHIITLVGSIVITIIYWGVLYDASQDGLSATNILTHAFNSVVMFIDLLIVAHPLRLLHIVFPVLFGIIYVTFSLIYQLCGGVNKKGKPYIYHVIDWNQPKMAILTTVGVLVLCCCVYMFLFTIYKLRSLIYRRLNNASFVLPTTIQKTTNPNEKNAKGAGESGIQRTPTGISMVLGNYAGYDNQAFNNSKDASAAQDTGEQGNDWNRTRNLNSANDVGGGRTVANSANMAAIDIGNAGKIKFDPPKVPVIFVLGGPGSGKVTHCDTFMQERRGVTHINMMDLLQQYAMGNDMQDFSQLSSKTVTEVLMLEMKMAPAAKAYLISGYPRSMRDVVEYSEKIQVVNGVILISWRQSVLQKQIDYGAKLGHVVLSLAKMELENFFKNVMPVADYFDQSDMLIAVNGERAPAEVYKDFRTAVLDILSTLENQEAILNGVTGMGRGIHDIPGSIVSVDTAPSQAQNIPDLTTANTNNRNDAATSEATTNVTNAVIAHVAASAANAVGVVGANAADIIARQPTLSNAATSMDTDPNNSIPPVIWVIGGPGSNKATLCLKAVGLNPGWGHISVGRLLRTITDSAPRANTESYAVKEALSAGEMVPEKSINNVLDMNLRQLREREGIIIDGYPRNLQQVKYFENKYKQRPPIILLDCSKLQLGRGRIDDTVSSFRRRLELFREQTLPMLKTLDNSNRLQIVDGDTDSPSVQREFEKIIRSHIQNAQQIRENGQALQPLASDQTNVNQTDAIVQDLETNMPGAVPTISHHVSLMNGHLKSRNTNSAAGNHIGNQANGDITRTGRAMDFRQMLEEAERYPVDSYM